MRFLDFTCPTPEENLALDEQLLHRAETENGPEVLRLWESPLRFVVLGLSCKAEQEVHLTRCRDDGVPVLRRNSGGGTVLQGPGCVSYALILSKDRDPALEGIRSTNAYVLERIADALRDTVPGVCYRGISDLCVGRRKISGNAQRRRKDWILFHGTLLYAMDFHWVERYLHMPPRQPEYRADRGHTEFLANLPVDGDEIRFRLRRAWAAEDEDRGVLITGSSAVERPR